MYLVKDCQVHKVHMVFNSSLIMKSCGVVEFITLVKLLQNYLSFI